MTRAAEIAKMGEVLTNSQIGGRRNIIINGAMQVAQRGTSSTGIGGSAGYFTLDRWQISPNGTDGRLTMTQDSSAPSGFANSTKLACTTADTSIAAGEFLTFTQKIEGQDLQAFAKGTSDAKTFAVSFYVKGNANVTYVAELMDNDNSNRHVSKSFSVTTDWTRVELSFPADTTGAFDDDNADSMVLNIWLHAGTNFTSGSLQTTWGALSQTSRAVGISSFFSSTSNTFFITGVQLEVGKTTPFEHRSFGEELALCQRYFQAVSIENGGTISVGIMYDNGTGAIIPMDYKGAKMRVAPTITMPSAGQSGGNVSLLTSTSSYPSTTGSHTASHISVSHYSIRANSYSGLPNAGGASWFYNNGDVVFQYDSEL